MASEFVADYLILFLVVTRVQITWKVHPTQKAFPIPDETPLKCFRSFVLSLHSTSNILSMNLVSQLP